MEIVDSPSLFSTPRLEKISMEVPQLHETLMASSALTDNILRRRANSLSMKTEQADISDEEQEDELEESKEDIVEELQKEYDKHSPGDINMELKIDKMIETSSGSTGPDDFDLIKDLEKNELNCKLVDIMKKNSSIGKSNLLKLSLKGSHRKDGRPR